MQSSVSFFFFLEAFNQALWEGVQKIHRTLAQRQTNHSTHS